MEKQRKSLGKPMRNKKREERKITNERSLLVKDAIENGHLTRSQICKATGLTMMQLRNLFDANRELFAKYSNAKRLIVDQASDNLHSIVNNPKHPKHFEATKFVLTNYKSEMDDILESQDSNEIQVEGGNSTASRVVIKFNGSKD